MRDMSHVKHNTRAKVRALDSREMNVFRSNLVRLRELRGWSWIELQGRCGVTRQMLTNVATGKNEMTILRAAMVAKAFGLTLAQMLEGPIDSESQMLEAEIVSRFRCASPEGKRIILSVADRFKENANMVCISKNAQL